MREEWYRKRSNGVMWGKGVRKWVWNRSQEPCLFVAMMATIFNKGLCRED